MLESKSNALPDLATSHSRWQDLNLHRSDPNRLCFHYTTPTSLPNIRLELILLKELVFETNASSIPPIRHYFKLRGELNSHHMICNHIHYPLCYAALIYFLAMSGIEPLDDIAFQATAIPLSYTALGFDRI